MRAPKERFDFVHEFLNRVFIDDLHAKRVLSLANGTLGVMSGACLAVSLIGQALAKARGLFAKSAIKQVDRLLSNAGVVPWELFGSWVREVVGERREIVVAMDWTDFDADNQSTLALHLITRHGRATPLLWLTVDKDELKNQRNDFEDLCLTRLKALLPEGVAVTILADRSPDQSRGSAMSSYSNSWRAWASDTSFAFAAPSTSAPPTARPGSPPIGSAKAGGRGSCATRKSPPAATGSERSCASRRPA